MCVHCLERTALGDTHHARSARAMGARLRAAAALAALACGCGLAGAASTAPAVLRELKVYPGGGGGGDASLAAGWNNFSWRGSYDLNSTAVAPFRGSACAQALPQLYGALSFYSRTPFFGACAAMRAMRRRCARPQRG
jgi:hypothetical protein